MDRSYLLDAERDGAIIVSSTRVEGIETARGRAVGVYARAAGGATLRVAARRAVVLAASAVQTPVLLAVSGLADGATGRNFMCHPGASIAAWFREPVRMWTGATQGHEVIGLRHEGLKFEALGYDMAILASRIKGVGRAWSKGLDEIAHWVNWGCALKAEARGRVRAWRGRPVVTFSLQRDDILRLRRGLAVLGEMALAAGAEYVTPGVHGFDERVSDRRRMAEFASIGSQRPSDYTMAVTHMFGTARLGSNPDTSVVRPDFQHHRCAGLYIADSSVFPTNTGVNPQTSILALATLCGRRIANC
jgi:choline dehydrogenase-like flavoprotein